MFYLTGANITDALTRILRIIFIHHIFREGKSIVLLSSVLSSGKQGSQDNRQMPYLFSRAGCR